MSSDNSDKLVVNDQVAQTASSESGDAAVDPITELGVWADDQVRPVFGVGTKSCKITLFDASFPVALLIAAIGKLQQEADRHQTPFQSLTLTSAITAPRQKSFHLKAFFPSIDSYQSFVLSNAKAAGDLQDEYRRIQERLEKDASTMTELLTSRLSDNYGAEYRQLIELLAASPSSDASTSTSSSTSSPFLTISCAEHPNHVLLHRADCAPPRLLYAYRSAASEPLRADFPVADLPKHLPALKALCRVYNPEIVQAPSKAEPPTPTWTRLNFAGLWIVPASADTVALGLCVSAEYYNRKKNHSDCATCAAHTRPERSFWKKIPCRFHQRGECRDGDSCKFSHQDGADAASHAQQQHHSAHRPHPRGAPAGFPSSGRSGFAPKSSSASICSHYQRGGCNRGASCKFVHQDAGSRDYYSAPYHGASRGLKTQPCIYHQRGGCKRGHQCTFSHAPVPTDATRGAKYPPTSSPASRPGW